MIAKVTCTFDKIVQITTTSHVFKINNYKIIEGSEIIWRGPYILLPDIGPKVVIYLNENSISDSTYLWFNSIENIIEEKHTFYIRPFLYNDPENIIEYYNKYYFNYLDDSNF